MSYFVQLFAHLEKALELWVGVIINLTLKVALDLLPFKLSVGNFLGMGPVLVCSME